MVQIVHVGYQHGVNDVRILQKECKSLASSMRYNVTYVTSNKNANRGDFLSDGIKIHVIELKGANKIRLFKYIKEVEQFICDNKFTLVHIHEYVLLPLALKLAKKGFKVIYDKHENTVGEVSVYFNKKAGHFAGVIAGKVVEGFENRIINRMDGYVVVTPYYNDLEETVNPKAVLIPNYPFVSDADIQLKYDDYCSNKGKLCFAGGISDTWSIMRLVKLLQECQDYHLILAGRGDQNYLDTVTVQKNVDYLGILPHHMVSDVYHESYIGVALLDSKVKSLNIIGTLGNTKLFEIMAAGLPVICTDSMIWKQIIDKYHCGLYVDIKDDQAIIQAIDYLCDNPVEAYSMGQNGISAIKNEYNWEESEKKLLALYDSICLE